MVCCGKTRFTQAVLRLLKAYSEVKDGTIDMRLCSFLKGDVSETVRMFFEDSKSFPPAAKSLLTLQEVDASLSRLAQLTKEDEQQSELQDIAKK